MKYYIRNNFFMRIASESIDNYKMIKKLDAGQMTIEELIEQNTELVESIAIASPALYQSIKNRKFENDKIESIIRYYIRSMVRPTPYGGFSGISRGEFNDYTKLIKGKKKYKYSMVDAEWFYKLVEKYEEKFITSDEFKVKFNNQCTIRGENIINSYISNKYDNHEKQSDINMIIARYSKQVARVKNIAEQWIEYGELKKQMFCFNPNVSENRILEFLNNLIKNEILITECRVPVSKQDFLHSLLLNLEKEKYDKEIYDLLYSLEKINEKRIRYNVNSDRSQIVEYEEIIKMMKEIVDSKNYLNIISGFDLLHKSLSKKVKIELEEFIPFMVLAAKENNENIFLKAYKKRFVELYGEYREIFLLELLDENMGLGNPYKISDEIYQMSDVKENKIKNLLENKICLGLKQKKKIVNIKKREFELILDDEKQSMLGYSKSFEMNFKIYASCEEDIDKGNFEIEFAPCCGSDAAGKMLNRFYNILDEDGKEELKDIYDLLQNQLYSEVNNSDITYLPRQGRINNLCSGNRNYQYAIDIGIASSNIQLQIDLNDIVVGYDRLINRLYLKSVKTGKRLRVNSDNMLTYSIDNNIAHFLRDVSYSGELHPIPFIAYLEELNFKYIPQVNLNNIILLPEMWKIEKNDFEDLASYKTFVEKFKKLQNDWEIPEYIYIIDSDNYLLMDLSIDSCWKYLFNESRKIFKSKDHYYIKKGESKNQLWFHDIKNNYYQSEIVVECLAEEERNNENNLLQEFPTTISNIESNKNKIIDNSNRNYFLGKDGWIYFKIYLDEVQVDEILIDEIAVFLKSQIDLKVIERFFFIRYSDPKFHIRLRIKMVNYLNISEIISWLEDLKVRKKYSKYEISVYEREIERYGGIEIIEYAEEFFCIDSLFVCSMMREKEKRKEEAILGVYSILRAIFKSTIEIEEFLNQVIDYKQFRDDFKKESKYYVGLVANMENIIGDMKLKEIYDLRKKSVEVYFNAIVENDKKGLLTNTIKDIIFSLTHMFCNRIKGDSRLERWVYAIIRHSLHVINQKEKYMVQETYGKSKEKK